jgi:hypothetical protein
MRDGLPIGASNSPRRNADSGAGLRADQLAEIVFGSPFDSMRDSARPSSARNVLGTELTACCHDPKTGFYRDGYCHTGPQDLGSHTVCAQVTQTFLNFQLARGNDLVTPRPQFGFPGLKPGDRWCVCAARWKEALEAGVAPPVILTACHEKALDIVSLEQLRAHALQ